MRITFQSVWYLLMGSIFGMALLLIYLTQTGGLDLSKSFSSKGSTEVERLPGPKAGKIKKTDLTVGDRIVAINGIKVRNYREAYLVLQALHQPSSDILAVDVVREDDEGRAKKLEEPVDLPREKIAALVLKGAPNNQKPAVDNYKPSAAALYAAAESGNAAAVAQILDLGGKQFIDDLVDDKTPLTVAVGNQNLAVVKVLLENKADPNKAAADGMAPLMTAAELGNREITVQLLAAGADPLQRNAELKTAAEIADRNGFMDVAMLIDSPSPIAFLPADQRRKVPDLLSRQGLLAIKDRRPSDEVLSRAIRQFQARAGLPESGILTTDQFDLLVTFTKDWESKYSDGIASDATKKTFARLATRFFGENWTPVSVVNGYPQCDEETVVFELSPDQSEITWKTYRPGVTSSELAEGVSPDQEATFKVVKAEVVDGYDTITVKPSPAPSNGYAVQVWEVRDGQMRISLKEKVDSDEVVKGSFLAKCR